MTPGGHAETVYNFQVRDLHTYFVGDSADTAVLVHNDECTNSSPNSASESWWAQKKREWAFDARIAEIGFDSVSAYITGWLNHYEAPATTPQEMIEKFDADRLINQHIILPTLRGGFSTGAHVYGTIGDLLSGDTEGAKLRNSVFIVGAINGSSPAQLAELAEHLKGRTELEFGQFVRSTFLNLTPEEKALMDLEQQREIAQELPHRASSGADRARRA